ncbi:ABC transporter substrate-binding protein [Roseomonas sp. F4]
MIQTTRRTLLAAALTAPALSRAHAADPVRIRIGWSTMPSHLVPAVYQARTAMRHYGRSYVVEPINFTASTPQITAMAANQVDIGAFAPTAMALAVINARLDMRAVADMLQDGVGNYRSQTLYVKADSPIRTAEDLRGKRIGVNGIGSASYTAIVAMLRKVGLNERSDVTWVEVSFANQLPFIEDGKIDGTTIPLPMGNDLVKEGRYRALFTARDAMGPTQFTFFAARAGFLNANRAAVTDCLEDYTRAVRWMYDPANRVEALRIIAEVSRRPVASLQYMMTEEDYFRDPFLVPNVPGIQTTIDVTHQLGFLPRRIEVAPNYVDLSFIEESKRRIEASA